MPGHARMVKNAQVPKFQMGHGSRFRMASFFTVLCCLVFAHTGQSPCDGLVGLTWHPFYNVAIGVH